MVIVVSSSNIKFNSYLNKIKKIMLKILPFIFMALPLFTVDIITRIFGKKIDICGLGAFAPNAFTICWVVLILNFSIK